MSAWTDYPILHMGDIAGKEAPVREVEPLYFDRNKYVIVRVVETGKLVEFKGGYLYTKPGRCGDVPQYPVGRLPKYPKDTWQMGIER
jgi:hypothetical protein